MSDQFDDGGFDDLELGNALRRAAGAPPDADAAFPRFQRRVRVARIRRISVAASSSAAVILIGAGAFALAGRDRTPISPANPGITLDSVSDTSVTRPDDPTATTTRDPSSTGTPPASGTTVPPSESESSSRTTTPTRSTVPHDDGPDDDHDDGPDDDHDSSSGGGTAPTTASTTSVAPVSKRCTSAYGAFTAVRSGGTVTAKDITPAAGYSVHQVEQEDSSAKVVFRSGDTEVGVEALWTGSQFTCRLDT